jgi:hypothetical protein
MNAVWQYRRTVVGEPWLEKKLHFNNTAKLAGGWQASASALFESFAFDQSLYRDYALQGPADSILPFTGTPHIPNDDYVVSVETPQFARFSGSVFYIWGHDENFFEWSPASIVFATYVADWRPTDKLRLNAQYQLQSYDRRSDGSTVGVRRIPRLKAEYQLSRPVFLRVIGEYDARKQDTLRDDSRTGLPILIRDPSTGLYAPAVAFECNRFRMDARFSYQPTPGTVVFDGYSSILAEPEGLRFGSLRRTNDGFFLKISYLFRL